MQTELLWHELSLYGATKTLQKRIWIYGLGHAGVRCNERVDNLAKLQKATIIRTLIVSRTDILRALRGEMISEMLIFEETPQSQLLE